ncbi:hypothetical protein [Thermocatellispora tengchongensis]
MIDEAIGTCSLPASLMEVRGVQQVPPYTHVGLLSSPSRERERR